jgi:hypothetical protein
MARVGVVKGPLRGALRGIGAAGAQSAARFQGAHLRIERVDPLQRGPLNVKALERVPWAEPEAGAEGGAAIGRQAASRARRGKHVSKRAGQVR